MKAKQVFGVLFLTSIVVLNVGMGRSGQYDEEARAAERAAKNGGSYSNNPAKGIASGVREATFDSTADLLSETAEGTTDGPPIAGTLEGARVGGSKAVESAAKGVFKVATLGYGDTDKMRVEQPEDNTGDVTKFKISW